MSNRHRTPPRPTSIAAATLMAAGLTLMPALSQAQSYTTRLLTQPSGAKFCINHEARLSAAGDVNVNCFYPRVTLAGIWVALNGGLAGQSTSKTIVWRGTATSPTTLSGSLTQPRSYSLGMLPDSAVLGYIGSNSNDDYKAATLSQWKGSSRSTYALPTAYKSWLAEQISRTGTALLLTDSDVRFAPRFAVIRNGVATTLPPLPSACGNVQQTFETQSWRVNDNGQVAVLFEQNLNYNPPPNFEYSYLHTACLWNGSSWVVSPARKGDHAVELLDVNSNGTMLLRQQDSYLLETSPPGQPEYSNESILEWHASGQAQTVDTSGKLKGYGHQDAWIGGSNPRSAYGSKPATLWRNGQPVDLSLLASAPSGYALTSVIATNAKGQVLVVAKSTKANAILDDNRLVVLTPR